MKGELVFLLFAIWNAAVMALYGADKHAAIRGKRRIPEYALLLAAALMGAAGAFMAMNVFGHKTKHAAFHYGVPALLALNLMVAIWWLNQNSMELITLW